MKTTWLILVALFNFSAFADSTGGGSNSEITQDAKPYDSWNEHRIMDAEQQRQEEFQAKIKVIQARIVSLQDELGTKYADAKSAHDEVEQLRWQFLYTKTTTKDTWREIYGEKHFAVSSDSGFVKFSGQILEVAPNGIRVFGQIGNLAKTEYFVINFPYNFKEGENIDLSKHYVALTDGEFSYVSEDGYAKTLPKLNYGKPCAKPSNGDVLEQSALQSEINGAERSAKTRDDLVSDAKKQLQDANSELAKVSNEAASELSKAIDQALKYDIEYAAKGDILALKKMGERYQKGDGVEVDLGKSAEFYTKAEDRSHAEAVRIAEESRLKTQEYLKIKFLRNLDLADKQGNVVSALYVEKCYREGLGVEKDLSLAQKYHNKAISLGLPETPNRSASKIE